MKKTRAIIHGCYNTTNFGDLLLLELLSKYLSIRWNVFCQTLKIPKEVTLEYCGVSKSYFSILFPSIVIYGGGGYLHDGNGNKILTDRLLRYLIPARVWYYLKIPYSIFGPGGGPSASKKGASRIKWLCDHAKYISLRDDVTMQFVKDIGVSRLDIVRTSDLALTIKREDIPLKYRFNIEDKLQSDFNRKKIIGIHLEKIYENESLFIEFCNLSFLKNRDFLKKFHLVFFYDYQTTNSDHVKQGLNLIPELSFTLLVKMNHWETAELLRQFDAVLTTKLHVSIVAAAFGVPMFGFSLHEKTERFFNEIGRQRFQKMWDTDFDAINGWFSGLLQDDYETWNLDQGKLEKAKKSAELNFLLIDNFVKSYAGVN